MTSEQNQKLPKLVPKAVIGVKRKPNRSDLYNRRDPDDGRRPLRGLPDPGPDAIRHRAALELEQDAIRMEQALIDARPESSMRDSLTVLADPEAPESDPDWDTEEPSSPELEEEEERAVEDAFIAKVSGVDVAAVMLARAAPVYPDARAFVQKVRAVGAREEEEEEEEGAAGGDAVAPGVTGRQARANRRLAAAAAAEAPVLTDRKTRAATRSTKAAEVPAVSTMRPGTTRALTAAQAALALTNEQEGTEVTMEDLRTVRGMEHLGESEDTYLWTVGDVRTRELTVAGAALVLTNMRAGTDVTMQDLKTSRQMVDLWDCEDTFEWTVGNVEW